jgi:pSer/pThr/pTyr-binding forkhead associated (FHA) protein
LPLNAGLVIGRSSSANLVIDDEFASGRHARVVPGPNGWLLEDLSSTNGTYIGEQRITGSVAVRSGQQFRIGQTKFELVR